MKQWTLKSKIVVILFAGILPFTYVNCVGEKFQPLTQQVATLASGGSEPAATPQPLTGIMVPMVMAQGHMGRTLMSCDDGKTWIHDLSDSSTLICFGPASDPNSIDCDHDARAGHGIDFGDGYFYTNFGWGYNGSVRRSKDGVHWDTVKTGGWGSGLAYAKNSLFLFWSWAYQKNGFLSDDQGMTWRDRDASQVLDNAFLDHLSVQRSGNYIALLDSGSGIALSSDGAKTWIQPSSFLPSWASNAQFAVGKNRMVVVGYQTAADFSTSTLNVAISTDMGLTWNLNPPTVIQGYIVGSNLLFDGNKFIFWTAGKMWTSTDAITWQTKDLDSANQGSVRWAQGPVVVTPSGTFVSIPSNWGSFYANQQAYRSTDGITWDLLDANHFKGSHPVSKLINATIDSSYCK